MITKKLIPRKCYITFKNESSIHRDKNQSEIY